MRLGREDGETGGFSWYSTEGDRDFACAAGILADVFSLDDDRCTLSRLLPAIDVYIRTSRIPAFIFSLMSFVDSPLRFDIEGDNGGFIARGLGDFFTVSSIFVSSRYFVKFVV